MVIRRQDLSLSLKAAGPTLSRSEAPDEDVQDRGSATGAGETEVKPAPTGAEAEPAGKEVGPPDQPTDGPTINAPLSGTFYMSEGPGKPPFAKVGDKMKIGDRLCIVEAMKLYNEIKASTDCRILKILVDHGQAVQKDEPMMLVEAL